jgi:polyketide cyclase/dehydrase/lipid transport protein
MASIYKELAVEVGPEQAWSELRRVGEAHKLFAPVLSDGQLNGDVRTVRFANGMVVQERILDIDEKRRRVSYTVVDGPGMLYHHASMQVVDAGPGRCRFVWITDFLPREIEANLTPLIEQGANALKNNLEKAVTNPT